MSSADLAAIHAASMNVPRPWTATEIAALRLAPGLIEVSDPDGFALGRIAADEAELLTIAVRPEARRSGLGFRLLDGFHARAAGAGARRAILEVAASNDAARALYAQAGYAQVGLRRGYYTEVSPAEDAIVMARAL